MKTIFDKAQNKLFFSLKSIKIIQFFLIIVMMQNIFSCSGPKKEIFLKKYYLNNIYNIAITCSTNTPDVEYSINDNSAGISIVGILFGLIVFPAMGIEYAIRKGVDQQHSANIEETIAYSHIESKLGLKFLEILKQNMEFSKIDYISSLDKNDKKLSLTDHDATITLYVNKMSLERTVLDNLALFVNVRGTLKNNKSGEILWDRDESLKSKEQHTLDYYKTNGLKELDTILEKAATNLAYDFVYLK